MSKAQSSTDFAIGPIDTRIPGIPSIKSQK